MSESVVYMTCCDQEEAEHIAQVLVEKRLAACVNMLGGMNSVYWWEGKIEHSKEVVLVVKTRSELIEGLTHVVTELHSYEVPCIVSWPLEGGNPDFLKWIRDETS